VIPDDRGLNYINARIDKLKAEGEFFNKRMEVQMKSKLKTKIYKKLLRTLNHSKKRPMYPQQRNFHSGLYFKPPLDSYKRSVSITDLQETRGEPQESSKAKNFQLAKDEIENLMDHISEEMKLIEILKKGYSKNTMNSEHSYHKQSGDLARSTLKNFASEKRGSRILSRALGEVLISSRREREANILGSISQKILPSYASLLNK
jgi:hypothetical protein